MAFNVSNFRSEINKQNGILKNNKFLVRMPVPRGLYGSPVTTLSQNVSRMVEFWCEQANIPGVSLPTTEVRRYGYGTIEKKPYSSLNNDITLTFIGDGKGEIWTYFQQWMRLIVNYDVRKGINGQTGLTRGQTPFELTYKEQYGVDISIQVYDDTGKEVIRVILRDAYPIFVGDIQLNWADTNSMMRVPVTFTVFDWYNDLLTAAATPVEFSSVLNNTNVSQIDLLGERPRVPNTTNPPPSSGW